MSSQSDDDPVRRSSTERYSRVAADLDWCIVLGAASSIITGFLLKISVSPPSYFQFFDDMVLLAALYAVTVATATFIMPVIHHLMLYHRFDVERFLLTSKKYVMIGIICVMLAMYLGLGLALDSKLPVQFAYGLASLPFIFIFIRFIRHSQEISFDGT
jgi:hypothetical protein